MYPGKLSELLSLYQRCSTLKEAGGSIVKWIWLGDLWGYMSPAAAALPKPGPGPEAAPAEAYRIVTRTDPRVFLAQKILWNKKTFVPLHSPKALGSGAYLCITIVASAPP